MLSKQAILSSNVCLDYSTTQFKKVLTVLSLVVKGDNWR